MDVLGWLGALAGGFGVGTGLYNYQKDKTNPSSMNLLAVTILFALAAGYFTHFIEKGPFTNWWGDHWGPIGNIAIIAAISVLVDYLLRKYGTASDQSINTSQGDIWYKKLPKQSVYLLVPTVGMLGIGLNMALNSTSFQSMHIDNPVQLTVLQSDLLNSMTKGEQLPGSLINKIFINTGQGTNPSKVLYLTSDGKNSFYVNVVTIGFDGVLSPLPPNDADVPFFIGQPDGTIVPNPQAGMPSQSALLAVANSAGANSNVRRAAVLAAANQDKFVKAVKLN